MVLGIIFPSLINAGNRHSNHMFDAGTTGFMLLATTPGLAFFYGGLAGKRNILGIMIQSIVSMGITTIMWFNLVTTVRVSEADEDFGLDASLHGERAYDSGAL